MLTSVPTRSRPLTIPAEALGNRRPGLRKSSGPKRPSDGRAPGAEVPIRERGAANYDSSNPNGRQAMGVGEHGRRLPSLSSLIRGQS